VGWYTQGVKNSMAISGLGYENLTIAIPILGANDLEKQSSYFVS